MKRTPFILPLLILTIMGSNARGTDLITNAPATSVTNKPANFTDTKDGWFDMSHFLATGHGFVPMVMPITEPAVGYGAGVGLVFIDRPEPKPGETPALPNLAVIGSALTENGTWGAIGSYSHWWLEDRLQTHFSLAMARRTCVITAWVRTAFTIITHSPIPCVPWVEPWMRVTVRPDISVVYIRFGSAWFWP